MFKRSILTLSHRRRGSVYILVVAVLSVLALLTLTLSYMSQMDMMATRNFCSAIQARMLATTGFPAAVIDAARVQKTSLAQPQAAGSLNLQSSAKLTALGAQDNSDTLIRRQDRRMGGQMVADGQAFRRGERSSGIQSTRGGQTYSEAANWRASDRLEPFKLGLTMKRTPGGSATLTKLAGSTPSRRQGMQARRGGQSNLASAAVSRELQGQAGLNPEMLAASQIEDESAKINVNAVMPELSTAQANLTRQPLSGGAGRNVQEPAGAVTERELALLIAEVAQANRIAGVDARLLAHRIAVRRYGPDGLPGRARIDDNANDGRTDPLQDGIDNDRDGLIDEPDEAQLSPAHDGLDNNHNGVIDEQGEGIAQDGLDNNRDGKTDESTEAVDDPAEASSDVRAPVFGDDTPYARLEELLGIQGMTPELFQALRPYLTTFSVSYAAFQLDDTGRNVTEADAQGLPQVDPNTAPPEQLYEILKLRFPKASADLLGQYVANLIDRRDPDNLPTAVKIGNKTYYGLEINPCINEICPDPTMSECKDGQYVELYNPWTQPVNLTGWTLRGEGIQAQLQGSLPSKGFMVLTNDSNNENDSTPEDDGAEGSFYNIFHKVGTGAMHQLIEVQGMKLPVDQSKVQLVNPDGRVVDEFEYAGAKNKGVLKSLQRIDPRLRTARLAQPTPLEENSGAQLTGTDSGSSSSADKTAELAIKIMEQSQNQPFRSPLDVMLVSTAFVKGSDSALGSIASASSTADASSAATDSTAGGADSGSDHPYALPALSATGNDNLDVGLVDCFRIGTAIPPRQDQDELGLDGDGQGLGRGMNAGAQGRGRGMSLHTSSRSLNPRQEMVRRNMQGDGLLGSVKTPKPPRCAAAFGRVNLNTAALAVLATLPGLNQDTAALIAASRNGATGTADASRYASLASTGANGGGALWWTAGNPFFEPRWKNLSDFIKDETLWAGRPLYDRLDAVYPYSQMVTLHTLAVKVLTSTRPDDEAVESKPAAGQAKKTRRPSMSSAERILAGDRGVVETVSFRFIQNLKGRRTDPDLLYAVPLTQTKQAEMAAVERSVKAANSKIAAARANNPQAATRYAGSRTAGNVAPAQRNMSASGISTGRPGSGIRGGAR